MFYWVLRRQDHEWIWQRVRDTFDRHVRFGHRFQQSRLCLGGGAIDLIGENNVGKDGPGLPFEKRIHLVVNG